MSKKNAKVTALLAMLAILAFWVNADAISGAVFGASQENPQGSVPSMRNEDPPTPPPTSTDAAPVASGKTISVDALAAEQGSDERTRNPFLTLRQQFPGETPSYLELEAQAAPEMPPSLSAEIVFIAKSKRCATIQGHIVKIGDPFYGGRIASIEREGVTVEFKNSQKWFIPRPSWPVGEGRVNENGTKAQ